jgi:hypothetical protein
VKLHTRDDEEPEFIPRMIEREYWFYKGCRWCGDPHHLTPECPNRPGSKKSLSERVVSISNG